MKILVAEDDAVTRKLIVVTLERLGWDVIQAEDGNAAWQVFETLKGKDAPGLAVLDWMCPVSKASRSSPLRTTRASSSLPHSGHSREEGRSCRVSPRVTTIITKPDPWS